MYTSTPFVFRHPENGYRSSHDAVSLVDFVRRSVPHVVELGAGAGLATLHLLHRNLAAHVTAVEIDSLSLQALSHNVEANQWSHRVTICAEDVVSFASHNRGVADLVVMNPPYFTRSNATPARNPSQRRARQGIEHDPLHHFLLAARQTLGRRGVVCLVWPASDLERLILCSNANGLHPRRMRLLWTQPDRSAERVLIECSPGRPGNLQIETAMLSSPLREPPT